MGNKIILDADTVRLLSPACKAEIAAHLGLDESTSEEGEDWDDEDGTEYAELGLQAARTFLEGCNDKTTEAIQKIVEAGLTFSQRQLETDMGVAPGGLRGVWTGLTKRVRTITHNDEVRLIEWVEEGDGEWTGRLMPVTREAFRRALAE